MHQAMRSLKYDGATLGNHEFNYGLDYLDRVLKSAPMPYVNANVLNMDGSNKYTPYVIQRKLVRDTQGRPYYINVGVIGFTPPDRQLGQGVPRRQGAGHGHRPERPEVRA